MSEDYLLIIRYILEFLIIIPGALFALMPVLDYVRAKSLSACVISASLLILSVVAGAFLRYKYMFRSAYIFTPLVIIFFIAYFLLVNTGTGKKLFCFFNAVMLCSFCPLYTVFVMADVEAQNNIWDMTGLFTIESSLVYIALALIIGAVFFRTLYIKLPMLMTQEYIDSSWDYLFLVPLSLSALILWSVPLHPNLATVGRLRPVALIMLWLFLMCILLLYHVFWWTADKISQGSRLQNENTLLTMEGKRYEELKTYMDETRALRHDFRQHILVITQLAGSGKFNELQNYLLQFTEGTDSSYKSYCANIAVDAAASHYAALGETHGVRIEWRLNLPHNLPMKESDYCVILGNLLENALSAVKNLSSQKRYIHVISSLISDYIIGISIDNPFKGKIITGKNGLPKSAREGHGIGLLSVMNTVKRYYGSMSIKTDNNIFSVDIILHCNN